MGQLFVEVENKDSNFTVTLNGQLDENASFEKVEFADPQEVLIDLNGVNSINSCGIREWIKWIKDVPPTAKITYKNCPKVIIDQINMVVGFLPEQAKVESFYVPYYCESSGSEKMVLFQSGKEFNGESISEPEVKCDETGDEMEMDIIESKYFGFLKK